MKFAVARSDPCSPWMPTPAAKTPPTSPWTPSLVLPELPAADASERHRPVPELDAAAHDADLRDRAPIEPPSPHCHPMGRRSVLALDDNAFGQDAVLALDAAERAAADFALDAAGRDAAAQAASRRCPGAPPARACSGCRRPRLRRRRAGLYRPGSGRCREVRRRSSCGLPSPPSTAGPCSPWMAPLAVKTPPTSPWTPLLVRPELPTADEPERH